MGSSIGNETHNTTASTGWSATRRLVPTHHFDHEHKTHPSAQDTSPQGEDYRAIVARATHDAIRDLDLISGRIVWPQGLPELLGYVEGQSTNHLSFWTDSVHPEDRQRVNESLRDAIDAGSAKWSGEYRFRHANGSFLHVLERAAILRDENGAAVRLVGALMDVSERKQLQDQLCRSQKMEAFGQLAGGAAHDFNNFLTTILGYSELVIGHVGNKGIIADHVDEIRKAAGRASNLTAQLLAFSRKQALEPHVLDVNTFLHNLERSLLPLLGANIHIVCRLHPEKTECFTRVDPGQLTQIVLNLAVNARDAMPEGGELTLETRPFTVEQSHHWQDGQTAINAEALAPGEYVLIRIADTGSGMTDEVKAHLFEPFFTTKQERGVSGLGLATSYGIIRQSGGRVAIESELGRGTTVEIYLPRVSPPNYSKPATRNMPRGTERVLVLEDDVAVRHLSIRILRNLGYDVTEAASGDDAQRLISGDNGRQIDLLLTDVVMPQMSGRYFADWLRKIRPNTKIIFISGYLDESRPHENSGKGVFFLPKPFDPPQLAQTVRQALDS